MSAKGDAPRLRDDVATLTALVQQVAKYRQIDETFVEKDFRVTELLRSIASGGVINTVNNNSENVTAIFKGGTSLSRIFHIINRFSEDVDILLVFPTDTSKGARDRVLRNFDERAREHLGLKKEERSTQESTTGVKRNVRYFYPRIFNNPSTREYLLLEMGSRGGPNPHQKYTLRSMIAEYAADQLDQGSETWEEFEPFDIQVLNPERTLLEKLALLHNIATRFENDEITAEKEMTLAGRHFYDIKFLLEDHRVREALARFGASGINEIVKDIDERSRLAGWSFTPRPQNGFAESPVFDPKAKCRGSAEKGYETAKVLFNGEVPTFAECLEAVKVSRDLI